MFIELYTDELDLISTESKDANKNVGLNVGI